MLYILLFPNGILKVKANDEPGNFHLKCATLIYIRAAYLWHEIVNGRFMNNGSEPKENYAEPPITKYSSSIHQWKD